MSTFLPAEKGMTIRMPSTANLMLDSADRDAAVNPSPWNFQITRPQSILNGFFTRIATTEVVLEWTLPNGAVLGALGSFDLSYNNTVTTVPNPFVAEFYTAKEAIDDLVAALNAATAPNTFTAQPITSGYGIATVAQTPFQLQNNDELLLRFGFTFIPGSVPLRTVNTDIQAVVAPDFRPYRYLDFVSAQLTYNQDLKDSSTAVIARDVLCRWYFSWDNPAPLDAYGYPIQMGYTPFVIRRIFSPPKQIRWDNIQPVGNLTFQVFTDTNVLVPYTNGAPANWLMTLQVSEC